MREIVLCTAIAAVVTALFKMLVPDERYGKQLSFVISCFFVLVIAGSAMSGNIDLGEITGAFSGAGSYVDFSASEETDIKTATAIRTGEVITELLSEKGIVPEEIFPVVDISDSYRISIKQIRLVFPADFSWIGEAEEIVRGVVGADTEVICELKER